MVSPIGKDDLRDLENDEESSDPLEMELEIQRNRILYVLRCLIKDTEAVLCLPLLLKKKTTLGKRFNESELNYIYKVCAKYEESNSQNLSSTPLSKLDMKLAKVVKLIIDCKKLRPTIDFLLDQIKPSSALFLNDLRKLVDITTERLAITAPEEMEKARQLRLSADKNEQTKKMIIEVSEKLQDEREKLKENLKCKEEIISEHKHTIAEINNECCDSVKKIIHESENGMIQDSLFNEEKLSDLSTELRILQTTYNSMLEINLSHEKELKIKKDNVEADLIKCLEKYDKGIGDRQNTLDAINDEFNVKTREYKELLDLFEKQEKEYVVLMAEREQIEKEEMEAKLYVFLCNRAARRITRAWRAYKQRKLDKKKDKALRAQRAKEAKLKKLQQKEGQA